MGRNKLSTEEARILGPYRDNDRNRWMYCIIIDGVRTWSRCGKNCSKEEAEAEVEGARSELSIPCETTVELSIEKYLQYQEEAASKASAVADRSALLPLKSIAGNILITRLGPIHVERYLTMLTQPRKSANHRRSRSLSMATRKSYFLALGRACKWFQKHHYTAKDVVVEYLTKRADPLPWETKAGSKQINRGKAQLRNLSEAKRYLNTALGRQTAEERLASALPILTGISSGELLHIQAGAVDLDAGVLHVRSSEADGDNEVGWSVKTSHRVRAITIPDLLLDDLEELVFGLGPTAYLFRAILDRSKNGIKKDWERSDATRSPGWLRSLVRRVCRDADVKMVCPHGLRATHASLRATVADEAVAKIGDALGHADHGRTAAAHYVGASAAVPVLRILAG